jgi:uracil-DNA glycosylase family protein
MVRKARPPSAADEYLPRAHTLRALRAAAGSCKACPLWKPATQTVFGDGPTSARLMLIGEQPGNEEDLVGRPFVGPAGRLLDKALADAGVGRDGVYVTNVVKHFKFEPRGKRRIHSKPNAAEVDACQAWLAAELDALRPEVVVCLGATAAQALLGRDFSVTQRRGELVQTNRHLTIATWHPSAILRAPDPVSRARMRDEIVQDLAKAGARVKR